MLECVVISIHPIQHPASCSSFLISLRLSLSMDFVPKALLRIPYSALTVLRRARDAQETSKRV